MISLSIKQNTYCISSKFRTWQYHQSNNLFSKQQGLQNTNDTYNWMEGEIKGNKQLSDEPQHKDQGMITTSMLKTINIKYKILDKKTNFKHVFLL